MNYPVFDSEYGEDFLKAITKLRNGEEVAEFMSDMFTPAEARTFVSRWKAAKMLSQGTPYVEIQKQTGLSSATVARVSQALQFGTGGYRKVLERLKRR
ncbi:transposase [Candidatus Dojkabacteria bacterium]|uniref:Transposase n=1 Tax=Candidatus Dojkabacteria bacterium TaxID=2099670 RepID=A0A955I7Y0_9BACT|nr:transposase [Candidatus Dojkabacteria bacterium]